MDNKKNFTIKKVIKLQNEKKEEQQIIIEIKAVSNHFINENTIQQIERQLFNNELNISNYKKFD